MPFVILDRLYNIVWLTRDAKHWLVLNHASCMSMSVIANKSSERRLQYVICTNRIVWPSILLDIWLFPWHYLLLSKRNSWVSPNNYREICNFYRDSWFINWPIKCLWGYGRLPIDSTLISRYCLAYVFCPRRILQRYAVMQPV